MMTFFRAEPIHFSRPAGFTLIEMLVVMAIVSIMAATALPRMNLDRYKADAAMRVVQGTLQQAQRNAVQRQHDVLVGFDAGSGTMRVLYDVDNDRATGSGERVVNVPLEEGNSFSAPSVGVRGTATAAIAGSNLAIVNGIPTVIFRRDGAASTEVEVYVRGPGSSDAYRALTVSQATGRAQQYRYTGASWRRDGI